MRTIVALLKFLVGVLFILTCIVLVLLIATSIYLMVDPRIPPVLAGIGAVGIYIAVCVFIALVLMTGLTALPISAHDRMCELVQLTRERNHLLAAAPVPPAYGFQGPDLIGGHPQRY